MSWQYDANSSTMQWVNDGQGNSSEAGRAEAERTSPGRGAQNKPGPAPFSGQLPTGAPASKPPSQGGYNAMQVPPAPGLGPQLPPPTGPIFPDSPAQPISQGMGGKATYTPTAAPFGWDMSAPGVREQFWNNNQGLWFNTPGLDWVDSQLGQFKDPWQGEIANQGLLGSIAQPGQGQTYWNGVRGQANTMTGAEQALQGGYQAPNNAQAAFGAIQQHMPGSLQPQFDAFYDRMAQKAMSNVNTQAAARGSYGSNSALNGAIGAGLDVEAQRAKAATDFMLADSSNQMGWNQLLSNAGRSADISGQTNFGLNLDAARYGLDKTRTLGDLAFRAEDMGLRKNQTLSDIAFGLDDNRRNRLDAGISTAFGSDAARLGRLNSAYNAAGLAQSARENRVGGVYDEVKDFSGDVMNFFSQNYDALLSADASNVDSVINTMIAKEADQRGWDEQTRERIMRDVKQAWDMFMGDKSQDAAAGKK